MCTQEEGVEDGGLEESSICDTDVEWISSDYEGNEPEAEPYRKSEFRPLVVEVADTMVTGKQTEEGVDAEASTPRPCTFEDESDDDEVYDPSVVFVAETPPFQSIEVCKQVAPRCLKLSIPNHCP